MQIKTYSHTKDCKEKGSYNKKLLLCLHTSVNRNVLCYLISSKHSERATICFIYDILEDVTSLLPSIGVVVLQQGKKKYLKRRNVIYLRFMLKNLLPSSYRYKE